MVVSPCASLFGANINRLVGWLACQVGSTKLLMLRALYKDQCHVYILARELVSK